MTDQQLSSNERAVLACQLANSDFIGLHQQHAWAWQGFNQTLRIVVLLEALPWIVGGTITARADYELGTIAQLSALPEVIVIALAFTGVAGLVAFQILVYNRLDVLLYARALNGMRSIYAPYLPCVERLMPINPEVPKNLETRGFMRLIFVALVGVNSLYMGLAVANAWNMKAGVVIFFILIIFMVFWYARVSRNRPAIMGWDRT